MRILLDEQIPQDFRYALTGHDVVTARFAGLAEMPDGDMLDAMAGRFDVLLTADKSIPLQQNVDGRPFSVVLLLGYRTRLADLLPLVPQILHTLSTIQAGEVRRIAAP